MNTLLRCLVVCLLGSGLFDPATAFAGPAPAKSLFLAAGLREHDGQWLDACDEVVQPEIETIDLNGDGRAEVFVSIPGSCSGGATGMRLALFVKAASGDWKLQFNFPAASYRVLKHRAGGFPDLEISGPGMCFPVWRWGGKQYRLFRRCDSPL